MNQYGKMVIVTAILLTACGSPLSDAEMDAIFRQEWGHGEPATPTTASGYTTANCANTIQCEMARRPDVRYYVCDGMVMDVQHSIDESMYESCVFMTQIEYDHI